MERSAARKKELRGRLSKIHISLDNYITEIEKVAINYFNEFAKENSDITFEEFMNFLKYHPYGKNISENSIEILKIIVNKEMANKKISPVETDDK